MLIRLQHPGPLHSGIASAGPQSKERLLMDFCADSFPGSLLPVAPLGHAPGNSVSKIGHPAGGNVAFACRPSRRREIYLFGHHRAVLFPVLCSRRAQVFIAIQEATGSAF